MVKAGISVGAIESVGVSGLPDWHPVRSAPIAASAPTVTPAACLGGLDIMEPLSVPAPAHDDHPVYATVVPAVPRSDRTDYNRGDSRYLRCPPIHVGLNKENQR